MKSKNLIAAMAHDMYDQWQKCKTARGPEFEKEAKRAETAVMLAQGISNMADIQLKQLQLTGFLPDDNVLVDGSEVALINSKRNLLPQKKISNSLLNEFIER